MSTTDHFKLPFAPWAPKTHFVGRTLQLAQIEQLLQPSSPYKVPRSVVLVHGIEGIGKTQLALEFAQIQQDKYTAIFWIDGSTRGTIQTSFDDMAGRIFADQVRLDTVDSVATAVQDTTRDVSRWLSLTENWKWLLIVDNFHASSNNLLDKDEEGINLGDILPSADHGSVLVTSRTPNLGYPSVNLELGPTSKEEATEILEAQIGRQLQDIELVATVTGGIPSALTQAATHIRRTGADVQSYLAGRGGQLQLEGYLSCLGSQCTLARASRRTKDAVSLQEQQVAIRQKVLRSGHPDLLSAQQQLVGVYQDNRQFAEAVKLQKQVLTSTEDALGPDHRSTLASQQYLASIYQASGLLDEAVQLQEYVTVTWERNLGAEHPDTLSSRQKLASVYQDRGLGQKAIAILEGVVEARTQALGKAHPHTLASQRELAKIYQTHNLVEPGLRLIEDALQTQTENLGEDHPDTLAPRLDLANAYHAHGAVIEALHLFKDVAQAQEPIIREQNTCLALLREIKPVQAARGTGYETLRTVLDTSSDTIVVSAATAASNTSSIVIKAAAVGAAGVIGSALVALTKLLTVDIPTRKATQAQTSTAQTQASTDVRKAHAEEQKAIEAKINGIKTTLEIQMKLEEAKAADVELDMQQRSARIATYEQQCEEGLKQIHQEQNELIAKKRDVSRERWTSKGEQKEQNDRLAAKDQELQDCAKQIKDLEKQCGMLASRDQEIFDRDGQISGLKKQCDALVSERDRYAEESRLLRAILRDGGRYLQRNRAPHASPAIHDNDTVIDDDEDDDDEEDEEDDEDDEDNEDEGADTSSDGPKMDVDLRVARTMSAFTSNRCSDPSNNDGNGAGMSTSSNGMDEPKSNVEVSKGPIESIPKVRPCLLCRVSVSKIEMLVKKLAEDGWIVLGQMPALSALTPFACERFHNQLQQSCAIVELVLTLWLPRARKLGDALKEVERTLDRTQSELRAYRETNLTTTTLGPTPLNEPTVAPVQLQQPDTPSTSSMALGEPHDCGDIPLLDLSKRARSD